MDKILVIIPFYNVENHLEEAIESILQQTHQNWHLVLVDDASTDNSVQIAERYKNHKKVDLLYNKENRGAYYSINKALDLFKDKEWDYFHFHGADDISDLTRLEKIVKYLNSNSRLLGCKTTYVRVHFNTKEIDIENGRPHVTASEGISFISKYVFQNLGYYDNTRFSGDTDYWWRLEQFCIFNGYTLGEHKEILYIAYLRGDDNLTKIKPIKDRTKYYYEKRHEIEKMNLVKNWYRDKFE
jgi:glycosyltransferase involved in cell wall biosynthesis